MFRYSRSPTPCRKVGSFLLHTQQPYRETISLKRLESKICNSMSLVSLAEKNPQPRFNGISFVIQQTSILV